MARVDVKLLSIALIGALQGFSALAHEHAEHMPMGTRLGSVSFETSCQPQVQAGFNRAVALLHSFWLDEAERTFLFESCGTEPTDSRTSAEGPSADLRALL
jgi:hypothetical protein